MEIKYCMTEIEVEGGEKKVRKMKMKTQYEIIIALLDYFLFYTTNKKKQQKLVFLHKYIKRA